MLGSWLRTECAPHASAAFTVEAGVPPTPSPAALRAGGMQRRGGRARAQVRQPGGLPFAALVACLMAAMAAVYATQQAGPAGRAKKGRSTDRVD